MVLRLERVLLLVGAVSFATVGHAVEDLELKVPGTLRVIVGVDDLPELFAVDQPVGVEREMIESFARLHGLKVKTVQARRMPDRIPWLLQDKGDMLAGGLVVTESRKKLVAFATETFPIRHVAVTRRPNPMVTTVEALRGHKVGVTLHSSWGEEALAAGVPTANLDNSYTDSKQVLAALKEGKVSCVVMSAIGAMVEKRRDPELEIGLMIGMPTSMSFAVRKDQPKLLAALNDFVFATRKTATWSRLVVKYLGNDALDVLKKSRESPSP